MAKTFSQMTELERRVNRALLRAGRSADFEGASDEMLGYDKSGIRLAMDQAQRGAIRYADRYQQAQRDTEPYLRGLALDGISGPDDFYLRALGRMGVNTNGLPAAAAPAIFRHLTKGPTKAKLAQDRAHDDAFAKRFPNAARIVKA